MGTYVDGFLVPIPRENIEAYRRTAEAAGAREGETVVLAWIVYESREARDRINEAVMNDPRLDELMEGVSQPFDYKRMAYGGFEILVEA